MKSLRDIVLFYFKSYKFTLMIYAFVVVFYIIVWALDAYTAPVNSHRSMGLDVLMTQIWSIALIIILITALVNQFRFFPYFLCMGGARRSIYKGNAYYLGILSLISSLILSGSFEVLCAISKAITAPNSYRFLYQGYYFGYTLDDGGILSFLKLVIISFSILIFISSICMLMSLIFYKWGVLYRLSVIFTAISIIVLLAYRIKVFILFADGYLILVAIMLLVSFMSFILSGKITAKCEVDKISYKL